MNATQETSDAFKREQEVFEKANEILKPGPFSRFVSYLYAERKMLVFRMVHLMCTLIIWVHYGIIKFSYQEQNVPEDDPNYWPKRLITPVAFGSKHAILFQLALLPLTMSRFSISAFSESPLNDFIPMKHMMQIHIQLGYTMTAITIFALFYFLLFFGYLCADGDQDACEALTSEIMITGYMISLFLLLIVGTSVYRNEISYEWFYRIHHLVFVVYAIVVLHTIDNKQRDNSLGRERSQCFKWFTATIMYYVCDRAALHINNSYKARLMTSSTVRGTNGSKMVILRLRRPALFTFKPGHYAYLRLQEIDQYWHPFTIASEPDSAFLEFCIEVFDSQSWTGQLFRMMEGNGLGGKSKLQIDVELRGPCGTSLAKTKEFSHALAIGSGTGIVPMLSLFKQHISKLLLLDPDAHRLEFQELQARTRSVEEAEELRRGSVIEKLLRFFCTNNEGRNTIRRDVLKQSIVSQIEIHSELSKKKIFGKRKVMKQEAFRATRSIYGVVLLSIMPVFGVSAIALMISWNVVPVPDLCNEMKMFLGIVSILFHSCFVLVVLFIWNANDFLTLIDVVISFLSPFANWHCYLTFQNGKVLHTTDIMLYCLVTGYMTYRVWSKTIQPRFKVWKAQSYDRPTFERLELVWVTRSASQVSEILPDLNRTYESLVNAWGIENATSVCRVSVFVTDTNGRSIDVLKREWQETCFKETGRLITDRPDFSDIIQEHTIRCITTSRNSSSLLVFCGAPSLASKIHQCKIANDTVTNMTGNDWHQMEFVAEAYGGRKKAVSRKESDHDDMQSLCGTIPDPGEQLEQPVTALSTHTTTIWEDKSHMLTRSSTR